MDQKVNSFRHSRIVRSVRDFLTGLGLFALILTGSSYLPNRAATDRVPIFTSHAQASSAYDYTQINTVIEARPDAKTAATEARQGEERRNKVTLALVFASLVAFNLAFLRHLRRVYASPR
jgi:K+-transporting ATPase c subunit